MNNKLHVFYLGSYSHIIIADGIIKEKKISLENVYFVTYRGVKLPSCYKNNLLYDASVVSNTRKYILKNYFKFNKIFKRKEVCGYFPFQHAFPIRKFYSEYVFFEEGLSAYDTTINYSLFDKKSYLKQFLKQLLISPFVNNNIQGLLNFITNGSPFPIDCTLVGLTESSYRNVNIPRCKHETVHVSNTPLNHSEIKDAFIIVMDTIYGMDRMESTDNYLRILSDVLKSIDFGSRHIYLKLHPGDYRKSEETMTIIKKYLDFINYSIIDESLEDIALSNQNNIFFGNHSTILFYAPIYGNTNKAISYVRINAERDSVYTKWIQRWGGIEGTMNLLKQQVTCL